MLRIAEQFHASDLGRQRQGNEDNYFVRAPLFVLRGPADKGSVTYPDESGSDVRPTPL